MQRQEPTSSTELASSERPRQPSEIREIPPLLDAYAVDYKDASGATNTCISVTSTDPVRSGPYDAGLFQYWIDRKGDFYVKPGIYADWVGLTGRRIDGIGLSGVNAELPNHIPTDQNFTSNDHEDQLSTNPTMTDTEIIEFYKWQEMRNESLTSNDGAELTNMNPTMTDTELTEFYKWQEIKNERNDDYFACDEHSAGDEESVSEESYVYNEILQDLVPRRLLRVQSPAWSDRIRPEDISTSSSPYMRSSPPAQTNEENMNPAMVPREITYRRTDDDPIDGDGENGAPTDQPTNQSLGDDNGGHLGKRKRDEENSSSDSEPYPKRRFDIMAISPNEGSFCPIGRPPSDPLFGDSGSDIDSPSPILPLQPVIEVMAASANGEMTD